MTTQKKLIRRKQSLLELAEYLQKVSQACKINGVSRQRKGDMLKLPGVSKKEFYTNTNALNLLTQIHFHFPLPPAGEG